MQAYEEESAEKVESNFFAQGIRRILQLFTSIVVPRIIQVDVFLPDVVSRKK